MTRKTLSSLVAAGALFLVPGCYFSSGAVTPAEASLGLSVTSFDPYLDPYGSWLDVPGYGRTWQPSPQYVGADFYPYGTGGQWLYTDSGWVFESDYPFGWAVFHYGRWFRHANYGWLWVPGSEWGPSWVSWRAGGPYVGWAPLGPTGALGFSYNDWCFVPAATFTVRNVRAYSTGYYDFHHAVNVTSPVRTGRVGPPPQYISRATGVNIRPVPVTDVRSSGRVPPPRPAPAPSMSSGPVQVRPPPPPTGWRSQPRPPPPPSSSTFTSPRSYQPNAPFQSAPPPAPLQSPGGLQRAPPPPPASSPVSPSYRAAPPMKNAPAPAPSAPAPAPMYRSAPAPSSAPAPAPMNRPAPPPPSAPAPARMSRPAPPPMSAPAPAPAPSPSRSAPPPPPRAAPAPMPSAPPPAPHR